MSEKTFCEVLRANSEPAWTEATTHRFTRELADGTLDDGVFRRYLRLDYTFVTDLTGVIAHAIADAPTMDGIRRLTAFLSSVVGPENDYFERAFDALDVDPETATGTDIPAVQQSFRDLFGHATTAGGYAETLAVLVPVEWVYLTWASGVETRPDPFYLREWVDVHASADFEETVVMLREQLNQEAVTLSPRRRTRIERLFARAVTLEVAFFDAAYGGNA